MLTVGDLLQLCLCDSICAAMSMLQSLEEYVLYSATLTITATTKLSKNKKKIAQAEASLTLRHREGSKPDFVIADTVHRVGMGMFKDVFFLDSHPLVLKLMMKNAGSNLQNWPGNGREEQKRYDNYATRLSGVMMKCYGQVYLTSEYDSVVIEHNTLRSTDDLACSVGSMTLAEKLLRTGKDYALEEITTSTCSRKNWHAFAGAMMEILKIMWQCASKQIIPWDAKLDNVGLASPRTPGEAPRWVFCDLDGFRDRYPDYKNVGANMRKIVDNMMKRDWDSLEPDLRASAATGWHDAVIKMQQAMKKHLCSSAFDQRHWTCLCQHCFILISIGFCELSSSVSVSRRQPL